MIRPQVVVVKALASSLSIGSGGSAGREGPIIHMGAAMGSTFAQIIDLSVGHRLTLVAAGAGAGIAAAFNAPLGGMVFAVELMLLVVNVIKAMERTDADIALVADDPAHPNADAILGWIGPEEIAGAARRTARLMP